MPILYSPRTENGSKMRWKLIALNCAKLREIRSILKFFSNFWRKFRQIRIIPHSLLGQFRKVDNYSNNLPSHLFFGMFSKFASGDCPNGQNGYANALQFWRGLPDRKAKNIQKKKIFAKKFRIV